MVQKTKRSKKWINPRTKKAKSKKCPKRIVSYDVEKKYAGIAILADFWYGKIIEDPKRIRQILVTAANKANNVVLETKIHKFFPQGITGVVLLAESHITIHSWPERNYVGIDIFTCGPNAQPEKALEYLKKIYKPKKIKIFKTKRGYVVF